MSRQLTRMIRAQAETVAALAGRDLAEPAARLADARRLWVVGTGTSLHAAELGASLLESAGLDARAVAAARFARWSSPPRPGDAVILLTHTAETAFALRSRDLVRAAGLPLVSVTGPAGAAWPEAVTTPVAEESETYTVSYTAALTVLAGLAHHLGAAGVAPADLRRTADAVAASVDAPDVPFPARALALVGAGPWGVTAREGALKVREAARMLSEGFDADHFLHGSAVPYTAADTLVLVQPSADPDGLVAALGAAARAEGVAVATVETAETHPFLGQLPLTVRLQCLAERLAAQRGQDPDTAITGAWAEPALWRIGSGQR